jgi:DNA-binding MarR family transcriptional regulator
MSRENLEAMRQAVGAETQSLQSAVDAFDEAAAGVLGVNRTDLRCLEALFQGDRLTPGVLGPALGLTTGSVTAMLDRLERLGYVTRSSDPSDRRKVVVGITEEATRKVWDLYGPIVADGDEFMKEYTAAELTVLSSYLRRSRELYERHLTRARAMPAAAKRR